MTTKSATPSKTWSYHFMRMLRSTQ
jgi:hypothetical protein